MNRTDNNFDSILKSAVKECLDEEIAFFTDIDCTDVTVPPDVKSKIVNAAVATKKPHNKFPSWLKRIAAIGMVVGTLFSVAVTTDAIRIIFEYNDGEHTPQTIEQQYYPVVPDDWTYKEYINTKSEIFRIYLNAEGKKFVYIQKVYNEDKLRREDTTDSHSDRVILKNGVEGYIRILPENNIIFTWYDEYKFEITAHHMSTEEVVEIVNSIK